MKPSLSSLRSRALGLILLAILPLFALTLYSYFDNRNRAIRAVQKDELVAVRNLASIQETLFSNTKQLLMTLVRTPEVRRLDHNACNVLFAELRKQSPYIASIVATNSEGQILASAPANPRPVNYGDRLWFQKVLQTRNFVIGETVLGRTSGKYGTILAYPILDEEGRFLGSLPVQLDLDWLTSFIAKGDFPPTTAISMTDSSRKVLFRYPEPQKYLGQMWPADLVKAMAHSKEGVAEGVGLPGDSRLFAFVRLSPPWHEIWVGMGVPMDWAVTPVQRVLVRNLIVLGLVALLAMAIAWYGGELLVIRPFKKLQRVTEQLAAGDLAVRSGSDFPGGELGLLARSFDQMADSLQERQAALQESEERLRLAQSAARVGVWEWKPKAQTLDFTPELESLYGLQSGAIRCYQDWTKLVHPEDLSRVEAVRDEAIAQHRPFDLEFRIMPNAGETRWVQARGGAYYNENGRPERVFGTNFDITERKRAEEALHKAHNELEQRVKERTAELHQTVGILQMEITERERAQAALSNERQRFFSVLERIPAYVALISPECKIIFANREFIRRFGDPGDRLCHEFLFGRTEPCEDCKALQVFESKTPAIWEWLGADGNTYMVHDYPFRDVDGSPLILEMGVDITIRKKMELALKKSEENLRLLTSQVFSAQEKERKRIAMELHEGLGQSMTALKLHLRAIQQHLPSKAGVTQEDFDCAHRLLHDMVDDVRRISQALQPLALENLGLTVALKSLVDGFGKYQEIPVKVDIDDIQHLFSPQTEIHIYRIFQETLNNVVKHAQATQISLTVAEQNGQVDFYIKDNGIGFDPKQIHHQRMLDKSMGLASIKERLRMIGSHLNIESCKGMGTEISFSIPIDAK
jgi:PAS domain S-box-containing protein